MTRRTWRAGAATVALGALVLTGCAGGDDAGGTLATGEVPEEDATLTVWTFLPGNYEAGAEAYEQVVAGFEELHPQITVDLVDMPYPTYFDQVRSSTVSQTGPDVVTMYGGAQAYSYRDGLYPLQDAIDESLDGDLRYVDENYSPDGNLYIVPTGTYGYAVAVNQALFDEAGIDPEEALGDWDALLESCGSLEAAGIQPFAAGWQDGFLLETFLYMFTSQIMDDETLQSWTAGELPLTDPLFADALQYVLDMDEAGCFGGEAALGQSMYDDSFNQYFAGDAAMMATGSLSTAQQGYEAQEGTTVMAFPQVPTSTHEAPMIDAGAEAGWSVTRWTEHPEAATAWVNYMASPDTQQLLWEELHLPPNLESVSVEPTTPIEEAFVPLMQNSDNHTGFAAFPLEVLAIFEREAAPLIGGDTSVDALLEEAATTFEQVG